MLSPSAGPAVSPDCLVDCGHSHADIICKRPVPVMVKLQLKKGFFGVHSIIGQHFCFESRPAGRNEQRFCAVPKGGIEGPLNPKARSAAVQHTPNLESSSGVGSNSAAW